MNDEGSECKPRLNVLVLSFIDFEHPYGSHIRPYFLTRYLSKNEFKLVGACGKGKKESTDIVFVERKWLKFHSHTLYRYTFGLFDTYKIIRQFHPDIIYAHGYSLGFIATTVMKLSKLRLIKKIPIVIDLHGSSLFEQLNNSPGSHTYFLLSVLEKHALSNAAWITPASDDVKEFISNIYGITAKKITTIPNGVAIENFYPLPPSTRNKLRKKAGLQDKKVIILVAPRESAKSFDWSIQAIKVMYQVMSELYKTRKEVILLITGGGPTLKNPPPNVSYLNFVDDLNSILNVTDLALAPYPERQVCGGARNKILEYFASQLPVISTKSGMFGIPEAEPFKNYIPIAYNSEDIKNKILLALNMKKEELRKITDNAFQLILTKYTWKRSSALLSTTFTSLQKKSEKNTKEKQLSDLLVNQN